MSTPRPGLSRRSFLKVGTAACAGVAGASAAQGSEPAVAAAEDRSAVLVDLTRCIGCRACENACRVRQGRNPLPPARFGFGPGEGRLSFTNWTFVDFRQPEAQDVGASHRAKLPVKRQCMHCLQPACVSACPVAALHQTERGSVVYRAERCLGCRYCMVACPFSVPRYEWDEGLTPRVGKCDFCDDRVDEGRRPACVAACPTGALKFGKRGALLQEARGRREGQPHRYAALYGESVVGGTSWLYLSDVAPTGLGFREDLPTSPLPSLTWKALAKVPVVVVALGLILSGVYRWRKGGQGHADSAA